MIRPGKPCVGRRRHAAPAVLDKVEGVIRGLATRLVAVTGSGAAGEVETHDPRGAERQRQRHPDGVERASTYQKPSDGRKQRPPRKNVR